MSQKTNKKITVLISIFAMAFIAGYFILRSSRRFGDANVNQNIQNQNEGGQSVIPSPVVKRNSVQNEKIKLSETRYWKYAHLVSDESLDNEARAALSGFERRREAFPDGSVQIILKALSSRYEDQTYILKNGEKLYFIETAWGDDPQFREYNLGDDLGVKVDADGYVLKS